MSATRTALWALALLAAPLAAQQQPAPAPAPAPAFNPAIAITPYHANGIYAVGERVGWTLRAPLGMGAQLYDYVIRKNNSAVLKSGRVDLASGLATIEAVLDEPAMVYARLTPEPADPSAPQPQPTPADLARVTMGAAVAPMSLKPSVPRPADFDAFWARKLAALKAVPINPRLTPGPAVQPGVDLSVVTLDSLGSHVRGYLARPARPGKFPALVIFQYAGVYPLQPATAAARAAEGWLAFNVCAHDMEPTEATAPRDYPRIGQTDRETSYFLAMYLRDTRALDYIASRPDWDGRTIVLMGTSMGGQQSLVTAGLNPDRVTAVIVNVPSGADSNGALHGRQAGYPNWPTDDPRVMNTALYFDTVNFASRIRAPVLAGIGFIDTTSTPAGIFTALAQVPVPVEPVPMIESDHNNVTPHKEGALYRRQREALDEILRTGRFVPDPHWQTPRP